MLDPTQRVSRGTTLDKWTVRWVGAAEVFAVMLLPLTFGMREAAATVVGPYPITSEASVNWAYTTDDDPDDNVGGALELCYGGCGANDAATVGLDVAGVNEYSGAAAEVTGGVDPTVSTAASFSTGDDTTSESGTASASLSYYIEVVGPIFSSVDVDVTAEYSVSCNNINFPIGENCSGPGIAVRSEVLH